MGYMKVLFLPVLLCIGTTVFAQENAWFKLYSGPGYDRGEGIVQLDSDSSFYITGSSSSWGENQSAYLLHLDQQGNYLWSNAYGGSEIDMGKRILAKNNFLYLIGMSNSFLSKPDLDIYIVKLNMDGSIVWQRNFPLQGWQFVNDAAWKTDTSFVLVGQTKLREDGVNPGFYFELNIDGDSIQFKEWGGLGESAGHSVVVLGDTCVAYSGDIYSAEINASIGVVFLEDYMGNLYWSDTLNELFVSSSILDLHEGVNKLHAVGYRAADALDEDEIFINYLPSDGSIINQSIAINNQSSKRIEEVVAFVDANGAQKIAIGMENYSFAQPNRLEDILIANFNANGLYWLNESRTIEFENKDEVGQVILTLDSSYIVVGTNKTQGLEDFTFNGGEHIFVFKPGNAINFPLTDNNLDLSNLNTLVGVQNPLGSHLEIYPNPCTTMLHINMSYACTGHMYDMMGSLILTIELEAGMNTLYLDNVNKGVYFIRVEDNQYRIIKQ